MAELDLYKLIPTSLLLCLFPWTTFSTALCVAQRPELSYEGERFSLAFKKTKTKTHVVKVKFASQV